MDEPTTSNDDINERIGLLEKEIGGLKKKASIAVFAGLVLGGAGVFGGAYKWFAADSKQASAELDKTKLETAIARYNAVNGYHEEEIEKIRGILEKGEIGESKIKELQLELEALEEKSRKEKLKFISAISAGALLVYALYPKNNLDCQDKPESEKRAECLSNPIVINVPPLP